jgi:RNA polymerase sigma-70 factor (ECF subfamily)
LREGWPLEDAELVEQARRGDTHAYDALVVRYQDLAFRTAWLITGDTAEAEDAAQDAFVKAYAALARFRVGAAFRPWLLRIVANEARNRRVAVRRRATLSLRAAADVSVPAAGPSPEAAVLADEQRRVLIDALNLLREDDRMVIAYRYFLDLSEAEMAEVLGCARGTVKSRLARALARLRERMPDPESGVPSLRDAGGAGHA